MSENKNYQIRHYQLQQQLSDAEITVFKAVDTRKNEEVLIKFLLPRKPHSKLFLNQFEELAGKLCKIRHENLEAVLDYGFQEGVPYLVTHAHRHGSIEGRLDQLDWVQAARLLTPLAKALDHLHENKIIHQDVQPENIMIDRKGPSLSGAGLISILQMEGSTNLSGTGSGLLKPEYLAPEQWQSKPQTQSDIYALGVLFYELLTGQKPFQGNSRQSLKYQHSSAPVPRAGEMLPDLPKAVDLVIRKALAKNPDERFKNMSEFAQALEILGWGGSSEELKKLLTPLPGTGSLEKALSKTPTPVKKAAKPAVAEKNVKPKTSKKKKRLVTVLIFALLLAVLGAALFIFLPGILNPPTAVSQPASSTQVETPEMKNTSFPTETLAAAQAAENEPTLMPTEIPQPTAEPTAKPSTGTVRVAESDGMELIYIPAGEFLMGSNDREEDEKPQHSVTMDAFWIDKTEVTNNMFAACVAAGQCQAPPTNASASREDYYGNDYYADYPVIFINWEQANAYCEWAGRRLPTEAEWEKAARGENGNICPWGNSAPNADLLNYSGVFADTSPVGSFPNGASPYGVLDMSGNVWEWTADLYQHDYYSVSPAQNPNGPQEGSKRVIRGGSWYYDTNYIRSAYRFSTDEITRLNDVGFRCVVSD